MDNNQPDNIEFVKEEKTSMGSIRIADDVVRIITGLAASEVEGVAGMSGGVMGDITELLGRKNLSKGVKVEITEQEAIIDVFIIVRYGARIPEVAANIQRKVVDAVREMTGLVVNEININVQGVSFGEKKENLIAE